MSRAKVIGIAACCWFSTLFLLIGVLLCAVEAINVTSGKGESWVTTIMITMIVPASVALGVVSVFKIYHAPEPYQLVPRTPQENSK